MQQTMQAQQLRRMAERSAVAFLLAVLCVPRSKSSCANWRRTAMAICENHAADTHKPYLSLRTKQMAPA